MAQGTWPVRGVPRDPSAPITWLAAADIADADTPPDAEFKQDQVDATLKKEQIKVGQILMDGKAPPAGWAEFDGYYSDYLLARWSVLDKSNQPIVNLPECRSSGAAAAYVKEGFSNIRIGMFLEMATTQGALVGALIASMIPTSFIAVLFGLVLLYSAYFIGSALAQLSRIWPIQIQLLVPTLSVVVLAIALASGASGYFGAMRQRQSQEESLRRVVATLTKAASRSPKACCGR